MSHTRLFRTLRSGREEEKRTPAPAGVMFETVTEARPGPAGGSAAMRRAAASPSRFWLVIGAITLASLALRRDGAMPDVSWLTSMCERILDGEIAYVDIFETAPPVPMLLYMPGVVVARLLGISSEAAVFATAYGAALYSLVFAVRILPERFAGSGASRWVAILPAAIFLFVLAGGAFAQREYFAAAFSLPMFAVFVRRAEDGSWPAMSDRFIAASLAGLAVAIKPPIFALPFLGVAAFEWARTRSLSFLFPSMLPVAAATGIIVTAVSLAMFPAYLDGVMTLMREVYVPIRSLPLAVETAFLGTAFCLAASFILSIGARPSAATKIAQIFAAAFLATYLIQGKYFPYHAQPAALFALIALVIRLYGRAASLVSQQAANAVSVATYSATAIAAMAFLTFGFAGKATLMRDLSWAEGLDRPTALAVSPDVAVGFPLAEHINARWVDRIHSQWVAKYTRIVLQRGGLSEAEKGRYQRYYEADLERTRRVIRETAPELIIEGVYSEATWLTEALLAEDPTLLDTYEPIAEEGPIRVLRRRAEAEEDR